MPRRRVAVRRLELPRLPGLRRLGRRACAGDAMRVIFAGSRYGRPIRELTDAIALSGFDVTEVVHGGAAGVDAMADAYARKADIPITIFPADWKLLGKAAGPMRNRRMAVYADALIALDGGDGTGDMIRAARRAGLLIHVQPPSGVRP